MIGALIHLLLPLLLLVLLPVFSCAETAVRVVQAPPRCLAPDVLMDGAGVLHMVYGLNHNGFYMRSTDNGATFAENERVKIDNLAGIACSMCMTRARIGADDNFYIVTTAK